MDEPTPVEASEDPPPEHDPVVRMPRQMVALPEPEGTEVKTVLAVALLCALIGAALGAVGIGIVYATQVEAPRARAPRPRSPRRSEAIVEPDARDAGSALALVPDAGPPPPPPNPYQTTQLRLGRGRTLPAVLRLLRLGPPEVVKVVSALRAHVNMRSLQPADMIAAMREPASQDLRRVEYRRSPTQVFAAIRNDDGTWRGERVEVVQSTVRVAAGLRVDGTVEGSVRDAGLHPEVVHRLAEVFAAIDLHAALHPGDVVRIVLDEERINGEFFRYGRVWGVDYRGAMGRRRAYWVRLGPRGGDFFDASGHTYERGPLRAPVPGARISSRFNPRRMHPVLHVVRPHNGVDFAASPGTPVYAAAEGTVASVGFAGPSGNLVRVEHPALAIETGYAHLSRFASGLRAGQRVRAHQLVGYVGSTGRSTGPHLHFSVKRAGQFIDPLSLYAGPRSIAAGVRPDFDAAVAQVGAELDRIPVVGETVGPPVVDAGPVAAPAADPAAEPGPGEDDAGGALDPTGEDSLDEGPTAQ